PPGGCARPPAPAPRLPLWITPPHCSASLSHASTVVHSASTSRSPASFRPAKRLVATRKLQTATPEGMKRCSGSAPPHPTNSTRLTVPLICSMTLTSCTYSSHLSQPRRLASL